MKNSHLDSIEQSEFGKIAKMKINYSTLPICRMTKGSCAKAILLFCLFLFGCIESRPIQFGVVADVQYADKPTASGRHYAESLPELERCVSDFNRDELAFVIQLGDLIDGGPNAAAQLRTTTAVYDQLRMPHYHVLGNHDFGGIDRTSTMDILGLQRGYYRFDIRDWRFIVLDTQDWAIYGGWAEDSPQYRAAVQMLDALKAAGAPNAMDWNGGFGDEQLAWLEAELTDADRSDKRVIVFGHLPLMPVDELHAAWNGQAVVSIFEKYGCVKAYLCGHNHQGGYVQHNGIHYITLEAMVNAAGKDGAWATVTLFGNEISIEGFGAVTTRTLRL